VLFFEEKVIFSKVAGGRTKGKRRHVLVGTRFSNLNEGSQGSYNPITFLLHFLIIKYNLIWINLQNIYMWYSFATITYN
jgi:hypothetical protein